MRNSRKKSALLSTIVGSINSVIAIFLTFFLRTIVLKKFSVEYVGLYTFLAQTVGVLTGIDGGISSSLLIKIHRPIAENDISEIKKNFFLIRLVYTTRAVIVLLSGMIMGMFLPNMITTSIELGYIYKCYFLYLALSSLNYCFIYYYFMLETFQQRYVASAITCIVDLIISVLNIALINFTNSYMLYIFLCCLNTNISYYLCKLYFKKRYAEYLGKYKIEKSTLMELKDYFGMAVHTLSNTMIKHSDTVLMSVLVSLTATGFYSNYNLIVSGLKTFIQQLVSAIKDPFRNLSVSVEPKVAEIYIKRITFLYAVVAGAVCVAFCASADIFVNVFWGAENVLANQFTVFLMAMSFYILVISNPVVDYYYCKEYYRNDKRSPIIEVGLNLVASFILGIIIGINGIIIGTIMAYLYRIVHRAIIIYKGIEKKSCGQYLKALLQSASLTLSMAILLKAATNTLIKTYNFMTFLVAAAASFLISLFMQYCIYHRTSEYAYYSKYFSEIISKFRKKRNKSDLK